MLEKKDCQDFRWMELSQNHVHIITAVGLGVGDVELCFISGATDQISIKFDM
jgi:hypothetical protein